jgi:hypothetical protein
MTCLHRTTVTLALLGLLLPSLSATGRSEGPASGDSQKAFVISGRVGLPGVSMKGLPGDPVTDENGVYTCRVPQGWSGVVTPTREGFVFTPPSRSCEKVTADLSNQDYTTQLITFTISGNAGLPGVVMRGFPGEIVTDENGAYKATVPYGWAGKVMPAKTGYPFEPASRTYPRVTAPVEDQYFTPKVQMFTISNTIRMGLEAVEDVTVKTDPGGQTAVTDSHGRYALQVPYGWTGRLILSKPGLQFEPDKIEFVDVTSDIIDGRRQPPMSPEAGPPARYPRALLPGQDGHVFVIPTGLRAPGRSEEMGEYLRVMLQERPRETAEDLRVMLHILYEKLSEPRMVRGTFVDFGNFFEDRSRAFEAFYLQGSAAVFVLEMDSPFPAALPGPPRAPAQDSGDPVWQRARQKIYSLQDPSRPGLSGPAEEMDFGQFQEDLLKTLRHATNIRHMEPNEAVIVNIIAHEESGGWPGGSAGGSFSNRGGMWFQGGNYSTGSAGPGPSGPNTYPDSQTYSRSTGSRSGGAERRPAGPAPAGSTTTLSIQTDKGDIDAFAKGTLSFEQFQQRVRIFTY